MIKEIFYTDNRTYIKGEREKEFLDKFLRIIEVIINVNKNRQSWRHM